MERRERMLAKRAQIEASTMREYTWDKAFSTPKDSCYGDWRFKTKRLNRTISIEELIAKYPLDAKVDADVCCKELVIEISYKEYHWSKQAIKKEAEQRFKTYAAHEMEFFTPNGVRLSPYAIGCKELKSYLSGGISWRQLVALVTTSCDL